MHRRGGARPVADQLARVRDAGVGGEARLHGRHPVERREGLAIAAELDQRVADDAVGPRGERRAASSCATEGERAAEVVADESQVAQPERRARVVRACIVRGLERALGER